MCSVASQTHSFVLRAARSAYLALLRLVMLPYSPLSDLGMKEGCFGIVVILGENVHSRSSFSCTRVTSRLHQSCNGCKCCQETKLHSKRQISYCAVIYSCDEYVQQGADHQQKSHQPCLLPYQSECYLHALTSMRRRSSKRCASCACFLACT